MSLYINIHTNHVQKVMIFWNELKNKIAIKLCVSCICIYVTRTCTIRQDIHTHSQEIKGMKDLADASQERLADSEKDNSELRQQVHTRVASLCMPVGVASLCMPVGVTWVV